MSYVKTIDPSTVLLDWKVTETFKNKIAIEGLEIMLCGISASHESYGELVGSSANVGVVPDHVAWFELLERISIIKACMSKTSRFTFRDPLTAKPEGFMPLDLLFPKTPEEAKGTYQFAKSNGVALDADWTIACRKAAFELVERDLILRTWLGEHKPKSLAPLPNNVFMKLTQLYEVHWISFGTRRLDLFDAPVHSCGVFLFPKDDRHPLAFGFGAELTQDLALEKAARETIQRLGFLWGEEIPKELPDLTPSPYFHQEYYLCPKTHGLLREWIHGAFCKREMKNHTTPISVKFADISSPDLSDFHVAKAYSPETLPLVFGNWPGWNNYGGLEKSRLIHPIA